MKYLAIALLLLAPRAALAFDMADFAALQIDTLRLVGKPYLQRPWLFFLPEPAFSQMACGKIPSRCTVAAVTFPNGLIVVNIHKVDPNTVAGKAIIVHELVHITQTFDPKLADCVRDETQAYTISAQWAESQGGTTWVPKPSEIQAMCAATLEHSTVN